MAKALSPHPDRALPAGETREVARRIYESVRELPLLCFHGHVEAELFALDEPFGNPADLLVVPDHYVTRMLVSQGVPLERLGVPHLDGSRSAEPREIWREFCSHWHLFRATPSRYWIEHELAEVLGLSVAPSAETADELYDEISARLAEPAFRPRALLDTFRIEVISTTDPATDDLAHHKTLAAELPGRVIPTFRPDALSYVNHRGWSDSVRLLGEKAGADTTSYDGFIAALRQRRRVFVEAGALATDHGHFSASTEPLSHDAARSIYAAALRGDATDADAEAFAGHMLFQMAAMSAEDGLVMQLHPGVLRNYDTAVHATYGADKGYDIPVATEFTKSLRPLLDRFGHTEGFGLVLFTVDETVYSRELAPIAGVYPTVRLGAPWWFLDSPDGMRRFRELVTETAGFANMSGFVDDTRAFLSIPARHDLARRIDAGYLARLVAEHRLEEDEAFEVAADLAYNLAATTYRH
jgi:glucuronate isomerase